MNDTWHSKISEEMAIWGDSWDNLVAQVPSESAWLHVESTEFMSQTFTIWTRDRVYFPAEYDMIAEFARSVARNPDGEPTPHI